MQRIDDIRKLKAISKELRKDKIESLASTESNHLCNLPNYSFDNTFSINNTPSTIYKNERAD